MEGAKPCDRPGFSTLLFVTSIRGIDMEMGINILIRLTNQNDRADA